MKSQWLVRPKATDGVDGRSCWNRGGGGKKKEFVKWPLFSMARGDLW